jgi:hypothetical protein
MQNSNIVYFNNQEEAHLDEIKREAAAIKKAATKRAEEDRQLEEVKRKAEKRAKVRIILSTC